MELFPDKARVRLQSVVRGTFLCADEDGRGVSLTERQNTIYTQWLVHRVRGEDGDLRVLLHSAAYGGYLAVSADNAPLGHRGRAVVLRGYDAPQQADIVWEGIKVEDSVVVLRHVSGDLRADSRYLLYDGVSVDESNRRSTLMHWKIEEIPPAPSPVSAPPAFRCGLIPVSPMLRGKIQYMRPNGEGPNAWSTLWFDGQSVLQLKSDLAKELGERNFYDVKLCVRAGSLGRLTPLVTDLPANEETMDIVVLPTETADRFPRRSGTISNVPGWDIVLLGHAGPSDVLVSAQPHLRLWAARFPFYELLINMLDDATCSVQMRHSRTESLLTKSLPYKLSVLQVPVPDFDCIFKAVGVRMEEVTAPRETTVFSGPKVFRGCYIDSNWRVSFFEMATPHGPVLLLTFNSRGLVTFGAQMHSWPAFHRLRITRDRRRSDACNVRFQGTHDSREQLVPDVRPGVRMLPLPFLSEIWDAFSG